MKEKITKLNTQWLLFYIGIKVGRSEESRMTLYNLIHFTDNVGKEFT